MPACTIQWAHHSLLQGLSAHSCTTHFHQICGVLVPGSAPTGVGHRAPYGGWDGPCLAQLLPSTRLPQTGVVAAAADPLTLHRLTPDPLAAAAAASAASAAAALLLVPLLLLLLPPYHLRPHPLQLPHPVPLQRLPLHPLPRQSLILLPAAACSTAAFDPLTASRTAAAAAEAPQGCRRCRQTPHRHPHPPQCLQHPRLLPRRARAAAAAAAAAAVCAVPQAVGARRPAAAAAATLCTCHRLSRVLGAPRAAAAPG